MASEPIELYKRFRPKVWSELIGQEKVAASLQNAVKAKQVPTAYIFSGPRGTGKTSAALLLAKSINCLNPDADANPCNECEVCLNINAGTQLGVNYISMANKGGVDDVRELVREAELNQPVNRSVFILDEVHNLSKAGFDALLIPLESARMPALFIFCTTEIHKVPSTINSRIQSRKLNLVSPQKMMKFLEDIKVRANLTITDEDMNAAIKMGRGSVRDTLSALDSVISLNDNDNFSYGDSIIKALSKRDLPEIYSLCSKANNDNVDFRDFSEQLFEDLRDVLLYNSGVDREQLMLSEALEDPEIFKYYHGKNGIMLVMTEVGDALTQMSQGIDSRIRFEIAMLRSLQQLNKLTKDLKAQREG